MAQIKAHEEAEVARLAEEEAKKVLEQASEAARLQELEVPRERERV